MIAEQDGTQVVILVYSLQLFMHCKYIMAEEDFAE